MKPNSSVTVNVTNRTIVRTILWIVATILTYHFIGRTAHILTLIFISFFLALALNPAVGWMARKLRLRSRVRAAAIAYLTVIAILSIMLALIIPPLIRQTRTFINDVPNTVTNFQKQDTSLARTAKKYHLDDKLAKAANDFTSNYSSFGSTVLDTGKRIIGAVVSLVAVLVMTFMMLVEGPKWLELLWGLMPDRRRNRNKKMAHKMYKAVTSFVNGQVILAAIAGVSAFIALEIASNWLNVSVSPLALAGIVGVIGVIPMFGNPTAAVIVCLVCLLSSWKLAAIMLIFFVIYFFVENHTFQPYLQSKLNELTPLTVFVAALLGIGFDGFLGAIIAIPVASAVKIILEDYFERQSGKSTAPTENLNISGAPS